MAFWIIYANSYKKLNYNQTIPGDFLLKGEE
jgi:hypothetical protein